MAEDVGVEIVTSDAHLATGHAQDLVVIVWRGATTLERARGVTALVRQRTLAHQARGIGMAIVLEPSSSPPDAGARALLASAMRETGPHIRGVAYVVTHVGFGGAAIRSAITGLSLIAREPYSTQVFSEPDRAAAWLAARMGGEATAPRIAAAIERVRSG